MNDIKAEIFDGEMKKAFFTFNAQHINISLVLGVCESSFSILLKFIFF